MFSHRLISNFYRLLLFLILVNILFTFSLRFLFRKFHILTILYV